jgi:hypothetical protein
VEKEFWACFSCFSAPLLKAASGFDPTGIMELLREVWKLGDRRLKPKKRVYAAGSAAVLWLNCMQGFLKLPLSPTFSLLACEMGPS